MSEPDYLTTSEVAELVRRTPATVREWIRRGVLHPAGPRLLGGYLFRRADVLALVRGGAEPVKHATVDPAQVRAFVDATYRRSVGHG